MDAIKQREAFQVALQENMMTAKQIGSIWFAIATKWYQKWKNAVNYDNLYPDDNAEMDNQTKDVGPIDNTELLDSFRDDYLRPGLMEHQDFEWLPEAAWQLLHSWYGGGPSFGRQVVQLPDGLTSIEMYPQFCVIFVRSRTGRLVCYSNGEILSHVMFLSRYQSIEKVQSEILQAVKVNNPQHVEFYIKSRKDPTWALLDDIIEVDEGSTIQDLAKDASILSLLVDCGLSDDPTDEQFHEMNVCINELSIPRNFVNDLKPGDLVDFQLSRGGYHSGHVVEINRKTNPAQIELAYEGRPYDKNVFVSFDKVNIVPIYTYVHNWRDNLQEGDTVEYCPSLKKARSNMAWKSYTVKEISLGEDNSLLFHLTNQRGDSWTIPFNSIGLREASQTMKSNSKYDPLYDYRANHYTNNTSSLPKGVVGLDNLGNTCFMNSMLQCLSNCEPLTKYLLSDDWQKDMNKDNPLGQGGRIAAAYALLLKDIWSGRVSVCSPRRLKQEVGRAKADFLGYNQQDSQEFMSFLLDGVHEDLNRIRKKPYVEDVESKGRPDPVVALASWKRAKMRNDSIVWDLFAGQLKSHIRCNVCDNESITFDPYTTISLSISEHETKKRLTFTFAPDEEHIKHIRYKSHVPKGGVIQDIIDWLVEEGNFPHPDDAELMPNPRKINPHELLVVKVNSHEHAIVKFLHPQDPISDIHGSDWIYIYEIRKPEGDTHIAREDAARKRHHRAEDARAQDRAEQPITREEGETDEDIEALLQYRYVENQEYMLELRHVTQSRYGTGLQLNGLPEILSLPCVSGSLDTPPTGKQLYNATIAKLKKYCADPSYFSDHENPPFELVYGTSMRMFRRDECEEITMDGDEPLDQLTTESIVYVIWNQDDTNVTYFNSSDTSRLDPESNKTLEDKDDISTLAKCFDRNAEDEQLGSHDMWFCSKCRCFRQAYKKMDIYTAPDILVIHLKRFHSTNYGRMMTSFLQRDKLNNLVQFPLDGFDLSPWITGPQTTEHIYDCFGISNHSGGMGGGHYTAYAKNFNDNNWYSFNDSWVSQAPSNIVTRQAYVLFFKRRTPSGIRSSEFLTNAAEEAIKNARARGETVGSLEEDIAEEPQ